MSCEVHQHKSPCSRIVPHSRREDCHLLAICHRRALACLTGVVATFIRPRVAPRERVIAARAADFIGPCRKLLTFIVDSTKLTRAHVQGAADTSVDWAGVFATCGGRGATQSSTIVYEIEPGGHLGWHTDATEETQYIIAGTGELRTDGGNHPVGPGSVFVLPTDVRHDLVNTGSETLRAVAFFAAAMFTQTFDEIMLPPNTHVLGTPNREG